MTSPVLRVASPSGSTVHRLAVASLVANVLIVVTGGAVRLIGSGLGCPTWPRCTPESFVAQRELGIHGVVEFSNRLFTIGLVVVAVATWAAVWRYRPAGRAARLLALLLVLGIPAQALLGGVTVLTHLNPWIVGGHFLLSMALIGVGVALVVRLRDGPDPVRTPVGGAATLLVRLTFVCTWIVLYVGTVVTGSGPHAGDADSPRTGLDPAAVSQVHANLVFLLIGLTVGSLVALRAAAAPVGAQRAVGWLLSVELAQAAIGFAQYFTDLPVVLVGLHLLGAALVSACATWLLVTAGLPARAPAPPPAARSVTAAASEAALGTAERRVR